MRRLVLGVAIFAFAAPAVAQDPGMAVPAFDAKRGGSEKVHMLGGVVSSPVAYALRGYVIEQKLPFVIMNAGADGLTQRQRSEWIARAVGLTG